MKINEFILQGSVESLAMGIHLGSFGIGVEMNHVQFFEFLGKMFGEFRAVVSEDEFDGKWKYLETEFKKFLGSQRGMRLGAPGESEPCVDVLERDDVSPVAVQMFLNGI